MEFNRVWILRGPNIWSDSPVLEAEVDFGDRRDTPPAEIPELREYLDEMGTSKPMEHLGDLFLQLALRLQVRAGSPVVFGTVQKVYRDGLSRVVVEYEEEKLGLACLETVRDLLTAAFKKESYDTAAALTRLIALGHAVRLGPSTAAIVTAAKQRDIPARRLGEGSLISLGWGARQRRVLTAETDLTGAIAQYVAQDKQLTRALLQAVGIPVPEGRPVVDAADAWRAAQEVGLPAVVKPQYGNQGRGVATNLTTGEQVERAYAAAHAESSYIMVERYIPGADYRLLVVGGEVVAASRREPAQIVGDGLSTVTELVAEANTDPRRSDGHSTSLSWIKLDAVGLAVLAEQGYTPESVPSAGLVVLIRRNGNLSTGGQATDVTDDVHPEVAARAVEAAQMIGLDVAGVDIVALDIGRPLYEQGAAVVEVNAGPGLRMHLDPSAGKPRPVGEAIVGTLFSPEETGRIPVVAITGVNGKTTTTRLLAHLLRTSGRSVGMACTDGIFIDGRRTETRDCAGPHSARAVLMNPRVEVAVLETARGGILREGLGFDRCSVAVVTNIGQGDHFGLRGIDTLEELARVKCVVVRSVAPTGTAVLNAEDPLVAGMAAHCPGTVLFFARDGGNPILKNHLIHGGRAVTIRDRCIVFVENHRETAIARLADVPLTHGGGVAFQIENALAAVGAACALGLTPDAIRTGLASFEGDAQQVPGRFNVIRSKGATVIVDYAHNPSAVTALVGALDAFSAERRLLVFAGCNRRDQDLLAMGEAIGRAFDRVILYRDWGNSGRADGELNALLRRGIRAGGRVVETIETAEEAEAIEWALTNLQPGDLIVLGVADIERSLTQVHARLATIDAGAK